MKSVKYIYCLLILIFFGNAYSQTLNDEFDKCGFDSNLAKSNLQVLGDHWGYSYDSLLVDLADWSANPYIKIDSLGASVQNRAIWQLTITSNDTANSHKQTVFLHARTHPGEVQSWWVTEQVINQLTSETDFARLLRENCVFYIIPMYNPDGVELEYARENANGVDIESNWTQNPLEPEVAILRNRFSQLMQSDAPIKVALNMHSAYGTNRYFVYHDQVGTSNEYSILEQEYIEGVRYYYLDGIEPWYYRITWTTGTPQYYPESWFWLNYQEAVMALTYEDWNSEFAHSFDLTANAILHGIADYLDVKTAIGNKNPQIAQHIKLLQNYPNPFNPITNIEFELHKTANVELTVFDVQGRKIAKLLNEQKSPGSYSVKFDATKLVSGMYFYQLKIEKFLTHKKMLLVK